MCEAYATAAITTHGRGTIKAVGPFANKPPPECVGCGACASICPTRNIASERTPTDYRIWDRVFPTYQAVVNAQRCVGCGTCEEDCPFSVARVTLRAAGQRVAVIAAEHCRGCGACVGSCPSGAIEQKNFTWEALVEPIPQMMKGAEP